MTKKIAILVADNVIAGGVITLIEAFDYCNLYWQDINPDLSAPLFECIIYSPDGGIIKSSKQACLHAQPLPKNEQALNHVHAVVIASAFINDQKSLNDYIARFSPMLLALKHFSNSGRIVSAYCSGSLILASTQLLDKRSATCAWWALELFQKNYPDVALTMNDIVVKDNNFLTAGATSANLSLATALIDELAGERLATKVSKLLLIDPNRTSQRPYLNINLPKKHNDSSVRKIQDWMQSNLHINISQKTLEKEFSMSYRTITRRFKLATQNTPSVYLQKLRIEQTKLLLESTNDSIEKIGYHVGFDEVSTLRKSFNKYTGISPSLYRKKFKSTA